MTAGHLKTQVLKLPGAMPVRTVAVDVTDGPDRGGHWEGELGTLGKANDNDLEFRGVWRRQDLCQ